MAFKKSDGPLSFEVNQDGINEIIEEKGNVVLMLREIAWNGRESHLELRKWIIDVDKEQPMKGVSFISQEGPTNLVNNMVKHGFGDTVEILKELKTREDFDDALVQVIGKKKVEDSKKVTVITNEDYYDPKSIIA